MNKSCPGGGTPLGDQLVAVDQFALAAVEIHVEVAAFETDGAIDVIEASAAVARRPKRRPAPRACGLQQLELIVLITHPPGAG
jgi:hypothetical protein